MAHRVVIIGGGFGGLYATKALRRAPVHVTLIDRRNFHLFQPLLYQVATGALSPGEIASPLRFVFRRLKNVEVLLAEVTDLDPANRRVILGDGEAGYDTLIVAAGASHHYFGHDEWAPLAPGLKTIEDATEIRSRILRAFEKAEREPDTEARRAWLTFVIVGGGPTGVELAGALGEIANDTLRGDFRHINPAEASILLVEGTDRVLPAYPADLSAKAEEALIRLGVRSMTGTLVTAIDAGGVTVRRGGVTEHIRARTVLWSAGVEASPLGRVLAERAGAQLDRAGRVMVEPDLTIGGHPEILVIGDLANFSHQTGKPLPGVAPVAMQQGRYAAGLVKKRLAGKPVPPFHYWDKGSLATIGRAAAVADFGRIHIDGLVAWLAWLFIHLMYLVEFDNRLLVLIQWAYDYFTYNRGARLITGERGQRPEA
ncbi:MAG TPA: NAD(P)/FAD-dependent oxidoreductase [Bryobacteraceae bacterium]|nr:NAD(P)/FAD-dependent oxidoreductase [Bryobacteraceae bacterium]